jgi:hypothetical protein
MKNEGVKKFRRVWKYTLADVGRVTGEEVRGLRRRVREGAFEPGSLEGVVRYVGARLLEKGYKG